MSDLTNRLRYSALCGMPSHIEAADRIDALEECLREAIPHIQGNGGAWEEMGPEARSERMKQTIMQKAAEAYALRDKARALLADA